MRKPFDPLKTAAVSKAKLEELTGAKESLSVKAWNTGGAFSVVVPYTVPGKLTPFGVEFGGSFKGMYGPLKVVVWKFSLLGFTFFVAARLENLAIFRHP